MKDQAKITLKKVRTVEGASNETICFSADLYYEGVLHAHVSNAGHGGSNQLFPAKGLKYHDVQWLDDLDVECHIFDLVQEYEIVSKRQRNALVLRKNGKYYTCDLQKSIAPLLRKNPTCLDGLIRKNQLEGYEVLNRNLKGALERISK